MEITGMGTLFCRGRGATALELALREGWKEPTSEPGQEIPAYRVAPELLQDRRLGRKIRRADRFSKMGVLAAMDALADGGLEPGEPAVAEMGIIVATGFGPHATTFRFLDDILDYGQGEVSPTSFSHSVHNAAAAYVASTIGCRGPTLTLTRFFFAFHEALALARCWLREGRCRHLLLGVVEECGTVMEYICSRRLQLADDGRIRPFRFAAPPVAVPGEGSLFFLLSESGGVSPYCSVDSPDVTAGPADGGEEDITLLDADGLTADERPYRPLLTGSHAVAGYAPLYGSMMVGSAFSCAIGALMLKQQEVFANPVVETSNQQLPGQGREGGLELLRCVRYDCRGRSAELLLNRSG